MIRQLITLPLRSAWRGAELLLDGASRALSLAVELTGRAGRGPAPGDRGGAGSTDAGSTGAASTGGGRTGRRGPAPDPAKSASRAGSQNGAAQTSTDAGRTPSREAPLRPPDRPAAPEPAEPAEPSAVSPEALDPEPVHVDEEPELVAESADPGAADGAGAELTIGEPWPGYQQCSAAEIIARLPNASDAELAVMELYESAHKRRRTVLSALERQLNDQSR